MRKEFRVAPCRDGQPLTSFWRFWVQGDEIYAASRNEAHRAKVSLHSSGKGWFTLKNTQRVPLCDPWLMRERTWWLALEIRFLTSEGAFAPWKPEKPSNELFVVDVPAGKMLLLQLLISHEPSNVRPALPMELVPAPTALWHTRLRDGRAVDLVARVGPQGPADTSEIARLRHSSDRPQFQGGPGRNYVEVVSTSFGPRGNILLITPLGSEAFSPDGIPSLTE